MFTSTTASTLPSISATEMLSVVQKMTRKLDTAPIPGPVQVIMVPDQPKFQISPDCPLTPEFRAEMNAWCLSFFGTTNHIADGEIISSDTTFGKFMYANPRTYARLQAIFEKTKQPSIGYTPSWPISGYDPSVVGWIR
jgi:hypothetical protein